MEVVEAIFVKLDRLNNQEHNRWEERDIEHQVVNSIADLKARNAHRNAVEEEVNKENTLLKLFSPVPLSINNFLRRFLQKERIIDLIHALFHNDFREVQIIEVRYLHILPNAPDLLIDNHHLEVDIKELGLKTPVNIC